MTIAEKNIVKSYSNLFDGLSSSSKIELLEKLTKSLRKDKKSRHKNFFESFGAFDSEKSAEEISKEIKESRKFNREDLKF